MKIYVALALFAILSMASACGCDCGGSSFGYLTASDKSINHNLGNTIRHGTRGTICGVCGDVNSHTSTDAETLIKADACCKSDKMYVDTSRNSYLANCGSSIYGY